jgi:hypothetical protein
MPTLRVLVQLARFDGWGSSIRWELLPAARLGYLMDHLMDFLEKPCYLRVSQPM